MQTPSVRLQRPFALKSVNSIGSIFERIGFTPFSLDANKILERAEQNTGFAFHDHVFREGLERLVDSLNNQSQLSMFGRFALGNTLQRTADSRFNVERTFADRLDTDDDIREPIFIVGMPRTGTTMLHALLHLDRNHRAPLCWECQLPYPAPRPDKYEANERIDTLTRDFNQIFRLVPDFKKKHYMTAVSPQECIGITALNFVSYQFIAIANLPDYLDWITHVDQKPNLHWHRRFLNFLESGGIRKPRWLLKSPVHLMRLRAIFDVYPDASIIVTHRNPTSVVASVASLISSARSLYTDHEDTFRTGQEQVQVWSDFFERFVKDRQDLDREEQFVDVHFDDFTRDQMAVVDKIYERFGWDLHPKDRQQMVTFLDAERQGKHGVHKYSLDQIGVSEEEVLEKYQRYVEFLDMLEFDHKTTQNTESH